MLFSLLNSRLEDYYKSWVIDIAFLELQGPCATDNVLDPGADILMLARGHLEADGVSTHVEQVEWFVKTVLLKLLDANFRQCLLKGR